MIDRGFIKWQPFNSLISNKEVLASIKEAKTNFLNSKPKLFPEEIEKLNEELKDAYYSHSLINLTYYENNHLKTIKTNIIAIYPNSNTLKLTNNTIIIYFIPQIIIKRFTWI